RVTAARDSLNRGRAPLSVGDLQVDSGCTVIATLKCEKKRGVVAGGQPVQTQSRRLQTGLRGGRPYRAGQRECGQQERGDTSGDRRDKRTPIFRSSPAHRRLQNANGGALLSAAFGLQQCWNGRVGSDSPLSTASRRSGRSCTAILQRSTAHIRVL